MLRLRDCCSCCKLWIQIGRLWCTFFWSSSILIQINNDNTTHVWETRGQKVWELKGWKHLVGNIGHHRQKHHHHQVISAVCSTHKHTHARTHTKLNAFKIHSDDKVDRSTFRCDINIPTVDGNWLEMSMLGPNERAIDVDWRTTWMDATDERTDRCKQVGCTVRDNKARKKKRMEKKTTK